MRYRLSVLDLPAELRLKVYDFAMPEYIEVEPLRQSSAIETRHPDLARVQFYRDHREHIIDRNALPYFMFTNQLIYEESRPIFWQRVTVIHRFWPIPFMPLVNRSILLSASQSPYIKSLRLSECSSQVGWRTVLAERCSRFTNIRNLAIDIFPRWKFEDDFEAEIRKLDDQVWSGDISFDSAFRLFAVLHLLSEPSTPVGEDIGLDDLSNRFSITIGVERRLRVKVPIKKEDKLYGMSEYLIRSRFSYHLDTATTIILMVEGKITHHTLASGKQKWPLPEVCLTDEVWLWDEEEMSRYPSVFDYFCMREMHRQGLLVQAARSLCTGLGAHGQLCTRCEAT